MTLYQALTIGIILLLDHISLCVILQRINKLENKVKDIDSAIKEARMYEKF
jgi:hypothetical protein